MLTVREEFGSVGDGGISFPEVLGAGKRQQENLPENGVPPVLAITLGNSLEKPERE